MEVSDKQIEKWVKDWITQYGSNQDYQDFMKIVDRIGKKYNMGRNQIQPFPYKNAAEIFEKSENPYTDLKTLIKIKGEDAVLNELKTLVTIYNKQFNKVLDQLDVIGGRIDDIYNFTVQLDEQVHEKFLNMMDSDSNACGEGCDCEVPEPVDEGKEDTEKRYCVCTQQLERGDKKEEEDFGINYEFDFKELGDLIKTLIKCTTEGNTKK